MYNYKDLDLNNLLKLINEHDDLAFSELAERYAPMIKKLSTKFSDGSLSSEELMNEALVALHRAALSYDVSQVDVSFGLYARICVYNKLLDIAERQSSRNRVSSDVDVERLAVLPGVQASLERQETVAMLKSVAEQVLSEYEHSVFSLSLAGYTTAEIARKLSKTPKSVDNAKARMLKHLRKRLDTILDV